MVFSSSWLVFGVRVANSFTTPGRAVICRVHSRKASEPVWNATTAAVITKGWSVLCRMLDKPRIISESSREKGGYKKDIGDKEGL